MPKRPERIVLIGGGGHAKVVIDAIREAKNFEIYGIIDPALKIGGSLLDVKVKGADDLLPQISRSGVRRAFISVGSIGDCEPRKRIYDNLRKLGFQLPVVIHPKAVVAGDVELGAGTFVAAGAIINTGTRIGKNVIVNTSSSVDHDCTIGDFVHIAPGAVLSGGVKVGDEAHVGTGANIIQDITIGEKAFIGAGSIITNDVAKGYRTYGQVVRDLKHE